MTVTWNNTLVIGTCNTCGRSMKAYENTLEEDKCDFCVFQSENEGVNK